MPVKIYIKPPDTKYVAKVIIFDESGDVLLLKRKKNQKYPEQWDLPGGHLTQGEDWIPGATREVKEETNLSIDNLEKVFESGRTTYYKTADYQGNMFDNDELPEHDEHKWINPNKIDELNNVGDIYVDAIKRSIA
jgi:8-oxo-dGTP pyrophosphatase MutT (NUDIX family)